MGWDGGRRFAIKLSRACLQREKQIGNQEYQGSLLQSFINTLKQHMFETLFPSPVMVTSNRSVVSCQVLQLLGDIQSVGTAH